MRKRTLSHTLQLLIALTILSTASIIGFIAGSQLNSSVNRGTERILSSTCSELGQTIENQLQQTQQAAQTLADYVTRSIPAPSLLQDPKFYAELRKDLDEMVSLTVTATPKTTECAIHFDPDILPEDAACGIVQKRGPSSAQFFPVVSKNINAIRDNEDWRDIINVQMPLWQAPHADTAGERQIVLSYLVPVFSDRILVGYVSIDTDYDVLDQRLADIKVYDTGYAVLTDANGAVIHHPSMKSGTILYDDNPELARKLLDGKPNRMGVTGPVSAKVHGVDKLLASTTLSNGLVLILAAPKREIFQRRDTMAFLVTFTIVLTALFFLIVTAMIASRLLQPLEALQKAAARIAVGDFDVHLAATGGAEIATLTRSVQQMAERLHGYVNYLEAQTYRDVLTGAGAPRAYEREVTYRKDMVSRGEPFSVIFFDVNHLKQVNDHFGHEAGDTYLQAAADLIRSCFPNSELFRTGGDEFVLFPEGSDLKDRYQLLDQMDAAMTRLAGEEKPVDRISISYGIADLEPGKDTTYEMLLARAEKAMYAMKERLHITR